MKHSIFILLVITVLLSCNNQNNLEKKQTLQDTFLIEMNKIKVLPNNYYFENKSHQLSSVLFSERFYNLMDDKYSKLIEYKTITNGVNIVLTRNSHLNGVQGLKEFSIEIFGRIDTKKPYFNLLSKFVSKSSSEYATENWYVITLDSAGKLISNMERIHEFYISNDTVHCLWYYASDPLPFYESWIQHNDGVFELCKQDSVKPYNSIQ